MLSENHISVKQILYYPEQRKLRSESTAGFRRERLNRREKTEDEDKMDAMGEKLREKRRQGKDEKRLMFGKFGLVRTVGV